MYSMYSIYNPTKFSLVNMRTRNNGLISQLELYIEPLSTRQNPDGLIVEC